MKTIFWTVAALMTACTLTLSGAGGDKKEKDKDPVPTFVEEDNGKTFPLEKDGKVRIQLKANPTTGYTWQIAKNDAEQLKPLFDKPKLIRPEKAPPGAGGAQLFEFQALKAGKTELELVYRRPFEKESKDAKTYKITFTIK